MTKLVEEEEEEGSVMEKLVMNNREQQQKEKESEQNKKSKNPVTRAVEVVRERYKSRREDRREDKEGEEIESMRTDRLFAAKADGSKGVPTCSRSVDPRLPEDALNPKIRGVCKALFVAWADVDDSSISVSKITGGITNMCAEFVLNTSTGKISRRICGFLVSGHRAEVEGENENNLLPVTVRVFGPNTDAVIDRDRELQTITYLSAAGFGAKLLGVFANGMVQSYLVARTLEPCDLPKPELAALIAVEVRRLHDLEIPGPKDPQLWADIHKFIEKASKVSFEDSEKQKTYETISFDKIRAEVDELKAMSDTLSSPIVFSHNDLLSGNFMYNEEEGKLHIIDYEYGSQSYRGYDIANYFNEHAGFDCDYSLYPDKEKQFYFFRHYLYPGEPEKASEAELEEFFAECNFYSLASHLYWGIWAIVQARFSPIDFDYLGYYFMRFEEYKKRKEEIFILTSNFLKK